MMLLFYSNIADSDAKTRLIPIFIHHYVIIGIPYLYIFYRYMNNLAKINKISLKLNAALNKKYHRYLIDRNDYALHTWFPEDHKPSYP